MGRLLVSVHCYAGDEDLVRRHLPLYEHHGAPVVILSPEDSPVVIDPHIYRHAGRRAYIGQLSLDRQIAHLRILLEYPFDFYFMCDPDSFCVSPELPAELFEYQNTLWSNQVVEPRPHSSPYPKLAFQPPYVCSRRALEKMIAVAPQIPCHCITPYIDWFMVALCYETGLVGRSFSELERSTGESFIGLGPWDVLRFRIERQGAVFMHPIKEVWQRDLCVASRKVYEERTR